MIRRKRSRKLWSPTLSATGWQESTFAEVAWDRSRGAAARWAVTGGALGLVIGALVFAPASWLAGAVASATGERVILADARGTVWSGSAVAVLTGGPGSRDATALPGRIDWTVAPSGLGFELQARHDCCLNGTVTMRLKPGFGRIKATLVPTPGWVAQWPSALLGGLGTPFNTLQLGGAVRLASPGLTVETVQGRWRLDGRADLDMVGVSSRATTLDALGSYRLTIAGDPSGGGVSKLSLSTQEGALQLSGEGSLGPGGVRFRGEARAGAGEEAALTNLLNIIGRRDGARSVISIG